MSHIPNNQNTLFVKISDCTKACSVCSLCVCVCVWGGRRGVGSAGLVPIYICKY